MSKDDLKNEKFNRQEWNIFWKKEFKEDAEKQKVSIIPPILDNNKFAITSKEKFKFSVLIFVINIHWYRTVVICL